MKAFLIGFVVFLLIIALASCAWSMMKPSSQPVQLKGGSQVYPVQVVPMPSHPSTTKPTTEEPSTQPSEPQSEPSDTEHPAVQPVEEPVEPVESPPHVGGEP